MIHAEQIVDAEPLSSAALSEQIRTMADPLRFPEDLDPLVDHADDGVVLVGFGSYKGSVINPKPFIPCMRSNRARKATRRKHTLGASRRCDC